MLIAAAVVLLRCVLLLPTNSQNKPAGQQPATLAKRHLLVEKPSKPSNPSTKEPESFFKRLERFAVKPASPKRRLLHAA